MAHSDDLTIAKTRRLDFRAEANHGRPMSEMLILIGRALALALRGHRELVFENLACARS